MNTIIFNIEDDAQFTAFTPVVAPLGEPVSLTRTALDVETDQALMGIWECTPGTWRRQVLQAEYSYFIAGSGRFLHDNGEVIRQIPSETALKLAQSLSSASSLLIDDKV